MPIKCRQCDEAEFEQAPVQLTGKVRGEDYSVEMMGLKCPLCKYQTIDGADMPEFGRLLSDKYRAAHGLLTSEEIRKRRDRLGMTQQAFAQFLGVGIASIKRWEMGKIQDERSNTLIIEKTTPPIDALVAYMLDCTEQPSTMNLLGNCHGSVVTNVTTAVYKFAVAAQTLEAVQEYFDNSAKEPLFCCHAKHTGWAIDFPNHQTVEPYIASFFNRHDRNKERLQYAGCH